MTAVSYNAARSLIVGHTLGLQYGLDLRVVDGYPRRSRKVGVDQQRTISDKVETLRHFAKATWQLQVLVTTTAELLALREFLDSTESGESFFFDEYGSVASPGTLVTVIRTQGAYSEERYGGTGATPSADAIQVTFDIEQA